MNETERDRILRLVGEGTLRPHEAAQLLATLAEEPSTPETRKTREDADAKPKEPPMEIQMRRADGTFYTIQVPQNLVAIFWEVAKVHLKEQIRTTAKESWAGAKTMVRNKAEEVRTTVKSRVSSAKPEPPQITPEEAHKAEARRRILQMVQNGRLNAADASRLIEQVDALADYQKTHAPAVAAAK